MTAAAVIDNDHEARQAAREAARAVFADMVASLRVRGAPFQPGETVTITGLSTRVFNPTWTYTITTVEHPPDGTWEIGLAPIPPNPCPPTTVTLTPRTGDPDPLSPYLKTVTP